MKGKLHITISGLKTAKNILNFMSDFNLENVDKGSSLIFNLN